MTERVLTEIDTNDTKHILTILFAKEFKMKVTVSI